MSELAEDSVLRKGDDLYIVENFKTSAGDVVVGELGNRRVKPKYMFDLGDPCPIPTCDGEIVEGRDAAHRHCSEGCLEWLRSIVADGAECPDYSCDDGEAIVTIDGNQYTKECTECSVYGFGTVEWREAWWPYAKQETLDYLKDCNDRNSRSVGTGTERSGGSR